MSDCHEIVSLDEVSTTTFAIFDCRLGRGEMGSEQHERKNNPKMGGCKHVDTVCVQKFVLFQI